MVSTYDATQLLDKDPIEMNFIEIIVREGNMIYIPYNWIYFIYNSFIPIINTFITKFMITFQNFYI